MLPSFPSCAQELEQVINEVGATLVVIDPLSAHFDPGIDTNNDASVRRALAALSDVRAKNWLRNRYCPAPNQRHQQERFVPWWRQYRHQRAARSALLVANDPEDERRRVLAATKMNLTEFPAKSLAYFVETDGEHQCAHIRWDGEVVMSADDLSRATERHETRIDKAYEWLEEYLADGPRTVQGGGGRFPKSRARLAHSREG